MGKAFVAGLVVAVVGVLLAGGASAGNGINGIFNLGVTNSVDAQTNLRGNTTLDLLRVTNTHQLGTDAGAIEGIGGPAAGPVITGYILSSGVGVFGNSTNGTGVSGESRTSFGVAALTSSATDPAVRGRNANGGPAGLFLANSGSPALEADNASTTSSAFGVLGKITSSTPGGFSAGVRGINNGTGGLGIGVYGSQVGSGWGVYGQAPNGVGVNGSSGSGTGVNGSSSSGAGVVGSSSSGAGVQGLGSGGAGVLGKHGNSTGTAPGVEGDTASNDGGSFGVLGKVTSTSGGGFSAGVRGLNASTGGLGIGVYGSQAGSGWGVYGQTPGGIGVYGSSANGTGVNGSSSAGIGVSGSSSTAAGVQGASSTSAGVLGKHSGSTGTAPGTEGDTASTDSSAVGVLGQVTSTSPGGFSAAVRGINAGTGGLGIGVWGSQAGSGWGVYGSSPGGIGVYGQSSTGLAGFFGGNVSVSGNLNVTGTKNFRIDDPLDPQHKFLEHAAIESNEVLNVYSGNATTGANGHATVTLPPYFDRINTDFRYQLTVIGQFAQAIVGKQIRGNTFVIRTDKGHVRVSWQVTARRNDAYMRAHPFRAEVPKTP